LWEIMLCSCLRASASWVTFIGPPPRASRMASLVGLPSMEKNL